MRILLSGILTLFVLALSMPQAQAQNMFEAWPALSDFHKVMAQTFHPAEDGDFAPIRNRSMEMVKQAKMLKKSSVPAQYNTPEIRNAVAILAKDSKKLHKRIQKGAADDEVKTQLFALHDTFHKIVGLCSAHNEEH
ncbi:MAG: hypothetical protein EP344_16200 [Bacteroidetes bacterium]|nr:MAG: hypothetical protein EP344_16200 [Bacteroidota bacterium]